MEKIISFSLYGNSPIYTNGSIQNAKIIPTIYGNDWKVRFYVKDVLNETVQILKDLNCEIIDMNNSNIRNGRMHRFLAIKKDNIVLIRDCDSVITYREKMMVDQFINSKKKLHIIRDHPNHKEHIMAGMYAFNCSKIDMNELVERSELKNNSNYMSDQLFLGQSIYPLYTGDMLIHDNFNKFYREKNELVLKWPRQINHIGQRITNEVGEDTIRLNEFKGYVKFKKNKFKTVKEMMEYFCNYLSISAILKRKYILSELYVDDEIVILDDYIIIKELFRYTFIVTKYESDDEFTISNKDMGCETIKLSDVQKIEELKNKDVLCFDIDIQNDLQYDSFTLYNVIQLTDEINYKIEEYIVRNKLDLYNGIVYYDSNSEEDLYTYNNLKQQFSSVYMYKDLFNDFSQYKMINEFVKLYSGMFRIHIRPFELIHHFSKRYWHHWDDEFKMI
jgi:hypothetical protein